MQSCSIIALLSTPSNNSADLATERERHLTTGKRAESTKLDLQCPICRSATGQASCLICARRRQLTFLFSCLQIGSRFVLCFFLGGGGGGKGISPLLPLLPTLDWDVRFCNSSLLFSAYAISSPGRPVGLCLKSLQHKRSATRCTLCQSQNRPPRKAWKSKVRLSATADQKC